MRKERRVVPNKQNEPLLPGWAKVFAAVAAIALATYIFPLFEKPDNISQQDPVEINLDDTIRTGACVKAGSYFPWLESKGLNTPNEVRIAIQKYYPNNTGRVTVFRYTTGPLGVYVATCVSNTDTCTDGISAMFERNGVVYCPAW